MWSLQNMEKKICKILEQSSSENIYSTAQRAEDDWHWERFIDLLMIWPE